MCRSKNGKCFGGYTSQKWTSTTCDWVEDTTAMLFNLAQLRIFKVKDGNIAIKCVSCMGPRFGKKDNLGAELDLIGPILGKNKC